MLGLLYRRCGCGVLSHREFVGHSGTRLLRLGRRPPGGGRGLDRVAKAKGPRPIRRGQWPRCHAAIAARFRPTPPASGSVRPAMRFIGPSPDATGTGSSCVRSARTRGISTEPHSAIESSGSSASTARPNIEHRGARSGAGATSTGYAVHGVRNGTPPWTVWSSNDAILGNGIPRGAARDAG